LILLFLAGCGGLPSLAGRTQTAALTDTADSRLGRVVQAAVASSPGTSGIHPLQNPMDAFAARVLLARAADRSLDVQYYIWHADITGYLLFEELWKAAGRGVRIRLLLDDNGIHGLDETIATLDAHPSIEVRLFNPFVNRSVRALSYVTDFDRLNRRMHNKSFTADNQATIMGGRNVGDEYFAAGRAVVFTDLDVLAFGPAASEVSSAFDLYWNSDSAYPADRILAKAKPDGAAALQAKFTQVRQTPEADEYRKAVAGSQLVENLLARRLEVDWAPTHLVFDEPNKGLGKAEASALLLTRLREILGSPQRELDLISPYFVPGKAGTEAFARYAQDGVRVRVITNSLSATDVSAVHAGYARRREPLVRSGVKLYEFKANANAAAADDASARRSGATEGSSGVSLHAKTFSVDRSRVFVGSFNFDPRSLALNTEMGLVIDSSKLAGALSDSVDREVARTCYEVRLAANGRDLEWVEQTPQGERRFDTDPETGFFRRLGVGLMSILPIEWLL
jgi:putative cardiolipin synthase